MQWTTEFPSVSNEAEERIFRGSFEKPDDVCDVRTSKLGVANYYSFPRKFRTSNYLFPSSMNERNARKFNNSSWKKAYSRINNNNPINNSKPIFSCNILLQGNLHFLISKIQHSNLFQFVSDPLSILSIDEVFLPYENSSLHAATLCILHYLNPSLFILTLWCIAHELFLEISTFESCALLRGSSHRVNSFFLLNREIHVRAGDVIKKSCIFRPTPRDRCNMRSLKQSDRRWYFRMRPVVFYPVDRGRRARSCCALACINATLVASLKFFKRKKP